MVQDLFTQCDDGQINALEALAKALPFSPRLKEWAPQDDDPAALRDDPAFAALMAG